MEKIQYMKNVVIIIFSPKDNAKEYSAIDGELGYNSFSEDTNNGVVWTTMFPFDLMIGRKTCNLEKAFIGIKDDWNIYNAVKKNPVLLFMY